MTRNMLYTTYIESTATLNLTAKQNKKGKKRKAKCEIYKIKYTHARIKLYQKKWTKKSLEYCLHMNIFVSAYITLSNQLKYQHCHYYRFSFCCLLPWYSCPVFRVCVFAFFVPFVLFSLSHLVVDVSTHFFLDFTTILFDIQFCWATSRFIYFIVHKNIFEKNQI